MADIEGMGPSGQDIKLYEQQYRQGLDQFQRALKEYSAPHLEVHKKEAFKKVMDNALQVLNETARAMKREDLLKKNALIAQNFKDYATSHSPQDQQKLAKDLNDASFSLKTHR